MSPIFRYGSSLPRILCHHRFMSCEIEPVPMTPKRYCLDIFSTLITVSDINRIRSGYNKKFQHPLYCYTVSIKLFSTLLKIIAPKKSTTNIKTTLYKMVPDVNVPLPNKQYLK